jgi:beta-phosphoglucomutase family hydrolase
MSHTLEPHNQTKPIKNQITLKGETAFDAVIFDLDGVITQTALVHSRAWKMMFDEFLTQWSARHGTPFKEFTHEEDYLRYVDGKPRSQGVQSFLESRGIAIPLGAPTDSSIVESISGLGNRKNDMFNEILEHGGVGIYESTVSFIKELKKVGISVGVASSSKNCEQILKKTGLEDLFATRIDGVVSIERNLNGKPHPDIFITACNELNADVSRTVIVEDAESGVQAGQRGRFGLVIGIAREHNHNQLRAEGADIVVSDLSEITIKQIENWFNFDLAKDQWRLQYSDYNASVERSRESLLTCGNGYFGTRGALEECDDNDANYPGTYVAGVYNRLDSTVADRITTNEDFVNIPNWLPIRFRTEQGSSLVNTIEHAWINPNLQTPSSFTRTLDVKMGALTREMVIADQSGATFKVVSTRFVSMANQNLAGISYSVTPLDDEATIYFESKLDGTVFNNGVPRYRDLSAHHLEMPTLTQNGSTLSLTTNTNQSKIEIAEVATHSITKNNNATNLSWNNNTYQGKASACCSVSVKQGETVTLEKVVGIATSNVSSNPLKTAQTASESLSFSSAFKAHCMEWENIWKRVDITVEGDRFAQKILRLHTYHLLATASSHTGKIDTAIPARGLHGEAYRGHIFWDEIFILPWYNLHFPEVTRATTRYRIKRLDAARNYASEHSYRGAMFPWQSGSEGVEETPTVHLNPISGKWGPDYSSFQRHVSLALAYNLWTYGEMTNDPQFVKDDGAELFFEICRFWVSRAEFSSTSGRYHIRNVMGPNEFHEHAKNCPGGGLIDNGYTNIMTAWLLVRGVELYEKISSDSSDNAQQVLTKLGLGKEEIGLWLSISSKLNLIIKDGVIAQFSGFFELLPLDFTEYKRKYGSIARMDRILKSENKNTDMYQVSKQADTLMAFYVLGLRTVTSILKQLGYNEAGLEEELLRRNYEYYLPRTSHGSTLSKIVHSDLAQLMEEKQAGFELYTEALYSDYKDVQGGTTGEGIHTGVMAASIWVALTRYIGFNFSEKHVSLHPNLPALWKSTSGSFTFRQDEYHYVVTPKNATLTVKSHDKKHRSVQIGTKTLTLTHNITSQHHF